MTQLDLFPSPPAPVSRARVILAWGAALSAGLGVLGASLFMLGAAAVMSLLPAYCFILAWNRWLGPAARLGAVASPIEAITMIMGFTLLRGIMLQHQHDANTSTKE